MRVPLLLTAALFCVALPDPASSRRTTWSGGQAGVSLNETELEIYSVSDEDGGTLNHLWLTGGNRSIIDNAIITLYVDGVAAARFQPNMMAGTGFVDESWPCSLGNCSEIDSNWGNRFFGKGSGMGGWYNNFRVPFAKSLRATIKSHVSTLRTSSDACHTVQDVDFWGNDLPDQQIPHVDSADDCCSLCRKNPACAAFTWHPGDSSTPDICFLKSSAAGARASPGNVSGLIGWQVLQGVNIVGDTIQTIAGVNSVADCAAKCDASPACKAFSFYDNTSVVDPNTCLLKNASDAQFPCSTGVYSGCQDCPVPGGDNSVFVLVRGTYGSTAALDTAGVTVAGSARMVIQERWAILNPLDYYSLASVPAGKDGMILGTTLAWAAASANSMEGCFHFFTPANQSFPGEIMATGTEDYYNSGYYFIDALPQHLPSTGQTFFQNFQGKWGPLNGGLRWSAFKLHSELDPLVFQDGAKLVWRNGDVADPGRGKCRHEGSGPPVGSPGLAITRSLAYIYVW